MAYIAQRGQFWRAEVRRRGYKPVYRTFDTRLQAQQWSRLIESEMDRGIFTDRTDAERTTLREALERYKNDVAALKRYPNQEYQRVDRWLRHDLAYRTLGSLRGADFARYRDERRDAGRAENTIRLELQLISHLFETARKEWGMESLSNPLKNIKKPSGSRARERRLRAGEYELIRSRLEQSGNRFARAAFDLAIETSLRQGALFRLQWEWVDLEARMVRIPLEQRGAENKGVPAVLPLSTRAVAALREIHPQTPDGQLQDNPAGTVLDTSANAIRCVWKRSLADLEIADLRWHDLRHEATSRLFERGLATMEVAAITGHQTLIMLKRYTHLRVENLLEKLG
ncbi:tyrosine-type recombinase/integrase [Pandoraea bronchicola]|uniref:Integrase n=1 Tax=Pandoraea bronchicola TaxID=2508287 RepID=A0A5E5BQU2_9BURK|nr:site-specific integrase [Pandoraea bronchicola]VVE87676.1 integrase [Pandoraea bronchicola]